MQYIRGKISSDFLSDILLIFVMNIEMSMELNGEKRLSGARYYRLVIRS